MARSRSGYKRSRYQPPPGVRIPVKTQEAWTMLTQCAADNGCTVGAWAESNLRYALSGTPYIGVPRRPSCVSPVSRLRFFEISEALYEQIERVAGEGQALAWIGRTLLFLGEIEAQRRAGEQVEESWSARYRI